MEAEVRGTFAPSGFELMKSSVPLRFIKNSLVEHGKRRILKTRRNVVQIYDRLRPHLRCDPTLNSCSTNPLFLSFLSAPEPEPDQKFS